MTPPCRSQPGQQAAPGRGCRALFQQKLIPGSRKPMCTLSSVCGSSCKCQRCVCFLLEQEAKHLMFNGVEKGQSHVWGDGIALVALVSTLSDIRRKCCHGRVREESLRRRREPGPGSRKVAVATVAGGTAPQTPPPSHYSPADSPHHHHHLHHRHPFSRHQALLRPSQNLLESSMNFLPGERRQF